MNKYDTDGNGMIEKGEFEKLIQGVYGGQGVAIEQTQSRGRRRVDGVGRLRFDFHTASNSRWCRFFSSIFSYLSFRLPPAMVAAMVLARDSSHETRSGRRAGGGALSLYRRARGCPRGCPFPRARVRPAVPWRPRGPEQLCRGL